VPILFLHPCNQVWAQSIYSSFHDGRAVTWDSHHPQNSLPVSFPAASLSQ
jgi:hypothetical protein